MIALGYAVSLAYGIVCLLLAALCYKFGMPKIYTRKLVHILVGFEWVILYCFHGASIHFLAVCLAFLALLIFVARKKLMPMISSEGDNSPGTVYYALSMSIMAFACLFVKRLMIPFGIAVFCTSFGDGFAGVFGQAVKKYNPKVYKNKSLFGSLANFLFSFSTVAVFNHIFSLNIDLIFIFCIAIFAVELELFTVKGLDNVTLPIGIFGISTFCMLSQNAANYLVAILATPVIVAMVYEKKLLSFFGICAALVLDVVISVSLGNFGFVLLLSFLLIGVLSDKLKKRARGNGGVEKKSGARDHMQVLANAAVGAVCAIVFRCTGIYAFVIGFAASLAEALADTAASSLGAFSDKTFDIFKLRRCEKGLSGGMSVTGTLASLVGAALIGGISVLFGFGLREFLIVLIAGFFGAVFDSFLGSIFQVKYRCTVCSKITEKELHCGERCARYSGIRGFNNDLVNFASTLFAAIIAVALYSLI